MICVSLQSITKNIDLLLQWFLENDPVCVVNVLFKQLLHNFALFTSEYVSYGHAWQLPFSTKKPEGQFIKSAEMLNLNVYEQSYLIMKKKNALLLLIVCFDVPKMT